MTLPLKWMPAAAHGGPFKAPAATCVVVHCTESENTPAMAEALAGPNWFGGPKAGTSAHKVVDVDSICEGVKRTTVAYHAGPGGNTWGVAYEFCGRASWTAAQWRQPGQLQMLRNAAPHIAEDLRAMGAPARWLSLAQVAAHAKGLCTHNDIRLALGGTTHTDPGPNFPYAELLAYVLAALTGTTIPEEDDMTPEQAKQLKELHHAMTQPVIVGETMAASQRRLVGTTAATNAEVAGLREALTQMSKGNPDGEDIVARVEDAIAKAVVKVDVTVAGEQ